MTGVNAVILWHMSCGEKYPQKDLYKSKKSKNTTVNPTVVQLTLDATCPNFFFRNNKAGGVPLEACWHFLRGLPWWHDDAGRSPSAEEKDPKS